MNEDGRNLVLQLHREALAKIRQEPPLYSGDQPEDAPRSLPEIEPGSPISQEWKLYREVVGRLLEEGNRGRFVLIRAGQPMTVWDTLRDAVQAADLLFPQTSCLVQQILPYLRPSRAG